MVKVESWAAGYGRTDQDGSFTNESAEFMRIAARPSALTSNLVKCSTST
jgi:hypothetical protein